LGLAPFERVLFLICFSDASALRRNNSVTLAFAS
jgi:hypothetical protein